MLGWLIISVVTVACTGTLAYFYYKLLNYFIRKSIESDPRPIWVEPEVQKVALQVADGDSDEENDNLLFREINNIVMKIHRA